MNDMAEQITWILTDFKDGRINYAEAYDKIDAVYVRAIGGVPMSEVIKMEKEMRGR